MKAHFLSAAGSVTHDYDLSDKGTIALQRLLLVIECVRPDVTFVPVSGFSKKFQYIALKTCEMIHFCAMNFCCSISLAHFGMFCVFI